MGNPVGPVLRGRAFPLRHGIGVIQIVQGRQHRLLPPIAGVQPPQEDGGSEPIADQVMGIQKQVSLPLRPLPKATAEQRRMIQGKGGEKTGKNFLHCIALQIL